MIDPDDSMMQPPIEVLLSKVDSKFTLVSLGATRARQINTYYNNLGDSRGTSIPPQVTSVARKSLSIAFEEIAADKIVVGEPLPEPEEGEEVEVEVEVDAEVVDLPTGGEAPEPTAED